MKPNALSGHECKPNVGEQLNSISHPLGLHPEHSLFEWTTVASFKVLTPLTVYVHYCFPMLLQLTQLEQRHKTTN